MSGDALDDISCRLFISDSHCHLKAEINEREAPTAVVEKNAGASFHFSCGIRRAVLCGTHPDVDWHLIEAATTTSPASPTDGKAVSFTQEKWRDVIIPGFGIHPWFVPHEKEDREREEKEEDKACHDVPKSGISVVECCSGLNDATGCVVTRRPRNSAELLQLLEDALRRFPRAIVGEIGLDKLRGPPESVQLPFFLAQMKIAARYKRPVSVHCVRAFGTMLHVLRSLDPADTPPAIVLHGFTGSLEFAKSAMMIRKKQLTPLHGGRTASATKPLSLFFGVGAATSLRVKGFTTMTLPFLLQHGRVLLETDAHHTLLSGDTTDASSALTISTERHDHYQHKLNSACSVAWDVAGCKALAELVVLLSGENKTVVNGSFLHGCEAAFEEAFINPKI